MAVPLAVAKSTDDTVLVLSTRKTVIVAATPVFEHGVGGAGEAQAGVVVNDGHDLIAGENQLPGRRWIGQIQTRTCDRP